jgi:hypothetical protein
VQNNFAAAAGTANFGERLRDRGQIVVRRREEDQVGIENQIRTQGGSTSSGAAGPAARNSRASTDRQRRASADGADSGASRCGGARYHSADTPAALAQAAAQRFSYATCSDDRKSRLH